MFSYRAVLCAVWLLSVAANTDCGLDADGQSTCPDQATLLQAKMQVEIDNETVAEVENILKNLAGEDPDAKKALEDLRRDGANASQDIAGKDHDKVKKAISEESENISPEEELNKTGKIITGKMLRQINNRTTSPEQTCSDCVQGDMKPGAGRNRSTLLQLSSSGMRFVKNLWKDGVAPYCFDPTIQAAAKNAFLDAVQHYKDHVPCLSLKEVAVGDASKQKCTDEPGIFVQSRADECSAGVGQPAYDEEEDTYEAAIVNLAAPGCDDIGTAVHEIGHIIGMLHENSRGDALKYVTVFWDNIKPEMKDQYGIDTTGKEGIDTTVPYDLMSVMHYEDDEFGKVGADGKAKTTMKPKAKYHRPLGNRQGLSFADVQQVASMYGCLDKVRTKSFNICTDPSETRSGGCSPSDCICHKGRSNKLHKIKKGPNCYQCAHKCPTDGGADGYCGCTEGFKKESWKAEDGVTYSKCTDATPTSNGDDDDDDDGDGDGDGNGDGHQDGTGGDHD